MSFELSQQLQQCDKAAVEQFCRVLAPTEN